MSHLPELNQHSKMSVGQSTEAHLRHISSVTPEGRGRLTKSKLSPVLRSRASKARSCEVYGELEVDKIDAYTFTPGLILRP